MESLNKKINDIYNKKEDNYSNGANTNKNNNINNIRSNKKNQAKSKYNEYLNILPRSKKKINIIDNSSFLGFRKNSNGNMKGDEKSNDNSIGLIDKNINVASLSNVSRSNLIDKNENIMKNIFKKEIIKEKFFNTTINNINSLYDNNYNLKFRINKDKYLTQKNNNKYNSNKLPINNYLNKSKIDNHLENSQMFRKNSSKILQRFCFICEAFEEKLYHTKNCHHLFCKECGKSFYEQQVEKEIYTIKCPKYGCNNNLNQKDIRELLSSESYTKIETFLKINNTKIINKSNENNSYEFNDKNSIKRNSATIELNINNNEKAKKIKIVKRNMLKTQIPKSFNKNNYLIHFSSKQHMLKISNFTRFKSSVKNEKDIKKIVCSKCGKLSLFSRGDQNFIRCLNCGNAICKYCYKQFKSSKNFKNLNTKCGICQSKFKFYSKKSCFRKILYEILFVIGGYLIVLIGFSKFEAIFFLGEKKKKKIFFVVFILFLIINTFLFSLFFPYFPIFISFFE